ncbi:MAG: CpsD/CapB family tyrosine-protein kinase [Gammaproteobacteria bacterium]|nr:CpsD/CapB family tyrosine-protein kinase [Gammaproteobacteria bacterium]
MERIRRALELARAEREAIRRAGNPARPGPDMVPMLVDTPVAQESSANEPFRNTLELTPNMEAIRRSRLLEPGLVGPAAEGFRMLRTQVMQRMQQRGWNTLAVLAPTAGGGATTVALNLAMAISADPKRSALLVDFNLRRPGVAAALGIPGEPGVEQCLMNEYRVPEVFVRLKGYDHLMIAPAAGAVAQSSELLASEKARGLVAELKTRYQDRIVLFDLPPVLESDDALGFAPLVDAVLLVIAEGLTRIEDVRRCFELLKDRPVIGTVLNQSRAGGGVQYAY